MKRIFEKYEIFICIVLIVLYVVINSYCIQNFGVDDYRSTIINTIFSIYMAPIFLTIVPVVYAIYINKTIKE